MRTLILGLWATLGLAAGETYTYHHENVLGTSLELKFDADAAGSAAAAEQAALAEIDRLNGILSSWDDTSAFRQWTRTKGETVPIPRDLAEVLRLYDHWRSASNGAVDAAAGAVIDLWRRAEREQRLPTAAEREAVVAAIRTRHWVLSADLTSAEHLSSASLVLASFTKSYIAEKAAAAAMRVSGVRGAVLNLGGDIIIKGATREQVHIVDPRADAENAGPLALLAVTNRAIATSGDYRRGFTINGKHYSHIVDPRTALPAADVASVTVTAPHGVDAGALATAMSVLGVEKGKRLASTVAGAEWMLLRRDGKQFTSPGWSRFALPPAPVTSERRQTAPRPAMAFGFAAQGAAATWNPAFELQIQLELARIEDGRYRRPFVAIWIEDKDKFPVRTIALWYDKPRWLPDLRAWYRGDRMRNLAEGTDLTASLASATRPPGRYTLKWDGKDNQGKLVKPGKYTVLIEVAREHGTYQTARQEVDFSATPAQFTLPGNTEWKGITLDYKRIAGR